jgi:hypothetical protein
MRLPALFALALALCLGTSSAHASEPDPTDPCRDDNLTALQQRLGYLDAAGEQTLSIRVACKRLPDEPGTAAIAVLHFAKGFEPTDAEDGDFDLHLMLADAGGTILAELRESGAATSDAVRLEDVAIDTGRYHLAPGVRAIGVAWTNAAHCYQCVYWQTTFGLFVRDGTRLRRVLGAMTLESASAEGEEGACVGSASMDKSTFAIGRGRHAGYADLVETTVTTHEPGFDPKTDVECPAGLPEARASRTWIYDGSAYQPVDTRRSGEAA